ncbi:uncharacterized protein LOC143538449 [Bidens hawaiensis]|uniref:uncharacterized protein LOC143538449 n=1 Tax=Bidens hawaiensis TaxID=980011 RepID=UPI00404A29C1
MTVSAYYTKLKGIWEEIQSVSPAPKCTCAAAKEFIENREKEQLYEFLMGLDEAFNTIKTQILTTKPTPSLSTAYRLVSEEEKRREIATFTRPNNNEAAAFQVQNRSKTHYTQKKERAPCGRCGRTNHKMEDCYLIVGYPKKRGVPN